MNLSRALILWGMLFLTLTACRQHEENQPVSWQQILSQEDVPVYDYQIIQTYPHRADAFTEGLVLDKDNFYESSGLYGKSTLRRLDLATGKILLEFSLPPQYFAEGIAIVGNQLYQLTYESNLGIIYDKDTFKIEKTFYYPTQGWGLTTDGKQLIMSDGSAALIFIDPVTQKMGRYVIANYKNRAIGLLNSLCYIDGQIYANILYTNIIAIISPKDGHIEGWIDLTDINPNASREGVMNGIAYDERDKSLYVTGKNWASIYKITITLRKND